MLKIITRKADKIWKLVLTKTTRILKLFQHKYPNAIKSWEDNWDNLTTFFSFSPSIRKIMYTTNAIESLNSQYRKVTKTKLIFPTDESLLKMLYLATEKITKRWTRIYFNKISKSFPRFTQNWLFWRILWKWN